MQKVLKMYFIINQPERKYVLSNPLVAKLYLLGVNFNYYCQEIFWLRLLINPKIMWLRNNVYDQ